VRGRDHQSSVKPDGGQPNVRSALNELTITTISGTYDHREDDAGDDPQHDARARRGSSLLRGCPGRRTRRDRKRYTIMTTTGSRAIAAASGRLLAAPMLSYTRLPRNCLVPPTISTAT
jgi:hypothetical protein